LEDLDYECDEEVRRYKERRKAIGGDESRRTASEGLSDDKSPRKGKKPGLPKHL
jgi:hypothetical protein